MKAIIVLTLIMGFTQGPPPKIQKLHIYSDTEGHAYIACDALGKELAKKWAKDVKNPSRWWAAYTCN